MFVAWGLLPLGVAGGAETPFFSSGGSGNLWCRFEALVATRTHDTGVAYASGLDVAALIDPLASWATLWLKVRRGLACEGSDQLGAVASAAGS